MPQLTLSTIMQAENMAYGHAAVLSEYAGFTRTRWIPGALQHGWNPFDGIGEMDGVWRPIRKFVWCEENARVGRERGGVNYHVIGAPWLYLLAMTGATRTQADVPSTISFPYHPTLHDRVLGSHQQYAHDLAEQEKGPVTVCLQWMDHADDEIRNNYTRQGFRVITFGRGTSIAPGQAGFLKRQHAELLGHTRAVSNRLSTALFYSASLGLEVGIYGTEMNLESEEQYAESGIPERWPALHACAVASTVSEPLWRDQLGADHLQPADQLRRTMLWDRPRLAGNAAHLARRSADLVRLNTRKTNGRRRLRLY